MNASIPSNVIANVITQNLHATNAGNLRLDEDGGLVVGVMLPRTAFGAEQKFNLNRPQILLTSRTLQFQLLVEELLNDCNVGIARVLFPDGRWAAAIVYENATKAMWCVFDPSSKLGRETLKDWAKHGNMQITFHTGSAECSMHQELTNSLIGKLLATTKLPGHQRDLRADVAGLGQLASEIAEVQGAGKSRLFVVMLEGTVLTPPDGKKLH